MENILFEKVYNTHFALNTLTNIGVMCNYHSSLKTAFCTFFVKTAIYERIFFYLCAKILSKEDTIIWQTKKSRANSRHSLCPISA